MNLNEKQEIAKNTVDGPLLIIAGAGSGKTATLTSRVEYMIKEKGIDPKSLLCVTFTNKAAREMRERIGKKLGIEIDNNIYKHRNLPLIGTFHSIGVFFLKEILAKYDLSKLGVNIKKDFLIYSEEDKLKVLKDILVNDLKLDEKQFKARQIAYYISEAKNSFIKAKEYSRVVDSFIKEKVSLAYEIYEKKMAENNALDFDDILFKTLELLKNPDILEYYQEKYRYIMVDEYQDTNLVQYEIVKLLASKYRNLAVVGDDWQSIYSWRGADMRNILNFKRDYPEAIVVKLEQNYRSTKHIIDAANCVVKNNKSALEKTLWTDNEHGEKICLIEAPDDKLEASIIAKIIKEKVNNNVISSEVERSVEEINNDLNKNNITYKEQIPPLQSEGQFFKSGHLTNDNSSKYSDNLILYRTNGQSRQIEEALMSEGIPYKVVGGLKFYDRKEVKDMLGYLRAIYNPNDVISFKRIINTPSRKIGSRTLEVLDIYKDNFSLPYFQILENVEEIEDLNNGAKNSVKGFFNLMLNFRENANRLEVAGLLDYIVDKLDYKTYLIDEFGSEEAEGKMDNIKELINLATNYNGLGAEESLSQFLEEVSLVSDLDSVENDADYVTLMTIHTSKGLEQTRVFIAGTEESIFPHIRSLENPSELEEERRLMYVAMTRAKKELYISRALERFYFGNYVRNPASRFIKEIPKEYIEDYKMEMSCYSLGNSFSSMDNFSSGGSLIQKIKPKEYNDIADFSVGDKVTHHKFGNGLITSLTGEIAEIAFVGVGTKKMNIKIAPVKKI
ncbi:UvrD-helicase domain-containing protein [Candidatus Gracilibacteria bacterium]|nr:UvrD-helicase domain-containing protein [Candidatus Gracilibacteria bacterium]